MGLLGNSALWGVYISSPDTEPRQPWSWVQFLSLCSWYCWWPGSLVRVVPPGCPQVRHVCPYSAASSPWRSPCFICSCSSGGRNMEMSTQSTLGLRKSNLRCFNLRHHSCLLSLFPLSLTVSLSYGVIMDIITITAVVVPSSLSASSSSSSSSPSLWAATATTALLTSLFFIPITAYITIIISPLS